MAPSPTPSADSRNRAEALREALATRVVVADGAMGTMLQAQDPTLEDFQHLEGCNEILNVTRPDIVRSVHEEYFAVGVDCVETNTFGANASALGEYDIPERIHELSESGARIAREVADEFTASTGQQRWVLGSIGPGTKLPTLGHAPYTVLRDGFQQNAEGLITGGADALIIETTQDLLQTKAAVLGARRALDAMGSDLPLLCSLAFETTGTMLLGSEIGAALTALEPLGVDMIGLNCSTGPAEMSEHLRYLTRHSRIPLLCMPNAGLPVLTKDGAHFPLGPEGLADAQETFVQEYGLSLVGGCCGTTPEHLRQVVERVRGAALTPATRAPSPAPPRCTRPSRSARTPRTSPSASVRTPTDPRSSARPCWRPAGTTAWRWRANRSVRARTCSTSASTTSAGTVSRTWRSWPDASPPPPRSRSCSTPPSCRSCGPVWRSSAAGRSSIPSTTRTATDPSRASPRSRNWPPSTVPR